MCVFVRARHSEQERECVRTHVNEYVSHQFAHMPMRSRQSIHPTAGLPVPSPPACPNHGRRLHTPSHSPDPSLISHSPPPHQAPTLSMVPPVASIGSVTRMRSSGDSRCGSLFKYAVACRGDAGGGGRRSGDGRAQSRVTAARRLGIIQVKALSRLKEMGSTFPHPCPPARFRGTAQPHPKPDHTANNSSSAQLLLALFLTYFTWLSPTCRVSSSRTYPTWYVSLIGRTVPACSSRMRPARRMGTTCG